MSVQFQDFTALAPTQIDSLFALQSNSLVNKLADLVNETDDNDVITNDMMIASQREQNIRKLRIEFGFDPDDKPIAHLYPVGTLAGL